MEPNDASVPWRVAAGIPLAIIAAGTGTIWLGRTLGNESAGLGMALCVVALASVLEVRWGHPWAWALAHTRSWARSITILGVSWILIASRAAWGLAAAGVLAWMYLLAERVPVGHSDRLPGLRGAEVQRELGPRWGVAIPPILLALFAGMMWVGRWLGSRPAGLGLALCLGVVGGVVDVRVNFPGLWARRGRWPGRAGILFGVISTLVASRAAWAWAAALVLAALYVIAERVRLGDSGRS